MRWTVTWLVAAVFVAAGGMSAWAVDQGAATPCCAAAAKGPFAGLACDESFGGEFSVTPPPPSVMAGGCYEIDSSGSCIGGGLNTVTGEFNGCMCVRRNGRKYDCFAVDKITGGGVGGPKCTPSAVAGCCAAGKCH